MNQTAWEWQYWYKWFKNRQWYWGYKIFAVTLFSLLLILDVWTKKIAEDYLTVGKTVNFLPGFLQIELTYNKGVAFGFAADNSQLVLISHLLFTIILFTIIFFTQRLLVHIGLTLILAGALGNLIDRFTDKGVVDFILWELFQPHSIFNLADVFVTFGTIITLMTIALDFFKNEQ